MAKSSFINKIFNAGPLILLYYLCISEVDTNLEKIFEIFTLNFQIILIYFWVLKRPDIMANGHIFLAGLINDVVMGFPLGISSLSYLIVIFVGTYVRNKSVNTTIASDWFTFFMAMIFWRATSKDTTTVTDGKKPRTFFINRASLPSDEM